MIDTEKKYKIDKTELMLRFIGILHSNKQSGDVLDTMVSKLMDYIQARIGREIRPNEKIDFYKCCLTFVQSSPATDERMTIMEHIFNLGFLEQ